MGEQRYEIQPYGVRYLCDCGSEMKPTGEMFMVDPPRYPHKCYTCGKEEHLTDKYPTVRWEKNTLYGKGPADIE